MVRKLLEFGVGWDLGAGEDVLNLRATWSLVFIKEFGIGEKNSEKGLHCVIFQFT